MTFQICQKEAKIEHFVISPRLMLKKWCELSSQRDGTCVKWKINFRQKNSFGQIAENNDGYDEISEKKIKNFQKINFWLQN